MLIHKGLFPQANRAIQDAEEEYVLRKGHRVELDSHLASVGAEPRTLSMFEVADVTTVQQMFEGGIYSRLTQVPGVGWKSIDAVYRCMGEYSIVGHDDELWRSTVLQQRYRVAGEADQLADLQQRLSQEKSPTEPGWYVWKDGWSDECWNLGHRGEADQHGICHMNRILWLTTDELKMILGEDAKKITTDTVGPFRILLEVKIAHGS